MTSILFILAIPTILKIMAVGVFFGINVIGIIGDKLGV